MPPFVPYGDHAGYDAVTPRAVALVEPVAHAPWFGAAPAVAAAILAAAVLAVLWVTARRAGATAAASRRGGRGHDQPARPPRCRSCSAPSPWSAWAFGWAGALVFTAGLPPARSAAWGAAADGARGGGLAAARGGDADGRGGARRRRARLGRGDRRRDCRRDRRSRPVGGAGRRPRAGAGQRRRCRVVRDRGRPQGHRSVRVAADGLGGAAGGAGPRRRDRAAAARCRRAGASRWPWPRWCRSSPSGRRRSGATRSVARCCGAPGRWLAPGSSGWRRWRRAIAPRGSRWASACCWWRAASRPRSVRSRTTSGGRLRPRSPARSHRSLPPGRRRSSPRTPASTRPWWPGAPDWACSACGPCLMVSTPPSPAAARCWPGRGRATSSSCGGFAWRRAPASPRRLPSAPPRSPVVCSAFPWRRRGENCPASSTPGGWACTCRRASAGSRW